MITAYGGSVNSRVLPCAACSSLTLTRTITTITPTRGMVTRTTMATLPTSAASGLPHC